MTAERQVCGCPAGTHTDECPILPPKGCGDAPSPAEDSFEERESDIRANHLDDAREYRDKLLARVAAQAAEIAALKERVTDLVGISRDAYDELQHGHDIENRLRQIEEEGTAPLPAVPTDTEER